MATKKTTPKVEETVVADDASMPETDNSAVTETAQIEETVQVEETVQTEETAPTETVEAPQSETQSEAQPDLNDTLVPTEDAPVAAERVEVPGGRKYETMFIVRVGEDANAATARVRNLIEQDGGAIDNVRVSGLRRLSYPIKKQIEGIDVVLNGRFTKETAAELDRALKLDEAVLRHMTLREDD